MNNDRETFRSLYSYRQRINISIISLSILVVLFALFVSQSSVIYTLTASILFAITLIFLSFVRPTPEEIVKNTYGIEDERDIAHSRELIERNKQFEEMKKKDLNISFGSSGKDLKYKSAKLTLPLSFLEKLGIDENNRSIELILDEENGKLIIQKK